MSIQLHARLSPWAGEPRVLRLVAPGRNGTGVSEADAELRRAGETGGLELVAPDAEAVQLPAELGYLEDGDIVRVHPADGSIGVVYRRSSHHNSMFLTERCNNRCIMCSQPPKRADDGFLVGAWLEAIPLMDPETAELGLSGGEPTLLGDGLLDILRAARRHLPRTALHLLSNGRLFAYLSLAQAVASVGCEDLMVGVPLYSDLPARHDYVVQAEGAFDETIRGLINLKRCNIRVELRVVLHRETVGRLPELARFVTRNLPFVDHVALMGLELMGFARSNLDALWVDPPEYQAQLRAAVLELCRARMNVSIYNHPLCLLEPALWPYARRSISDWKADYAPECGGCGERENCGGFFASSRLRPSTSIRPLPSRPQPAPL